jgi:LysM repeat protein
MNTLGRWKDYVPSKGRLYTLAALVAILAIGAADVLFVRSSVVPQLSARRRLISDLATAKENVVEARAAREEAPERSAQQVATAQARLDEAAASFLSESQAGQALNGLYERADETGVKIVKLQTQPAPEVKMAGYDVKPFRLEATGTLPRLVDFVSRIEWAAFEDFSIDHVSITQGEILHALTMEITLYTSPYASGEHVREMPAAPPPAMPTDLEELQSALASAWESEDWRRAIDLARQLRAADPSTPGIKERLYMAHVNYGYQLMEQGDTDGAKSQFDAALDVRPEGKEATEGLQQTAGTPSPTLTTVDALAQRLHDSWARQDWAQAIGLIEQIRAIDPHYEGMTEKLYAAHVNYGHRLSAEGKLEEAKSEFSSALTVKPDGVEAMAGLQELAGELLPSSTPPSPQPQVITYVVRRGDTLYSIARRHGTTVEAVMAANGLASYTIYVGQHLYIPTG